jgi:hypothetical protein
MLSNIKFDAITWMATSSNLNVKKMLGPCNSTPSLKKFLDF